MTAGMGAGAGTGGWAVLAVRSGLEGPDRWGETPATTGTEGLSTELVAATDLRAPPALTITAGDVGRTAAELRALATGPPPEVGPTAREAPGPVRAG